MSATRRAESILFWSMYDFRFCVANSVTSNIRILLAYYLMLTSACFPTRRKPAYADSLSSGKLQTNLLLYYFRLNFKEHREISQCRKKRHNGTQRILL
jgi:ABC-type transport system involved in Fe-S cluster assembly fused permease/ATPase subunit